MNTPTILLVTSRFPPVTGGSAVVYERLANFSDRQVMILTARKDCDTGKAFELDAAQEAGRPYPVKRITYVRPPERSTFRFSSLYYAYSVFIYLKLLLTVFSLCRTKGIRHVCAGEVISLGWLTRIPRSILNARVSIYTHGEELTSKLWSQAAEDRRREYLEKSDQVFCVSSFTNGILRTDFGIPEDKIVLLPNGVDTEIFTPDPRGKEACQRDAGQFYLVGVGRLIERKGFDTLIRAMAAVRDRLPAAKLEIIGEGPEKEALQTLISELGLDGTVVLRGRVDLDDLIAAYRAADLFVMPNRTLANGDTEGFGLVFLEANACGLPVIGGRAGGAVDAIVDGVTGYLIDPTDTDALVGRICGMLSDETARDRLSETALDHARHNSWARIAERFLEAQGRA